MNRQNLRVPTSEQAREYGRRGGKASQKKRKERKALREQLLAILEDDDIQQQMCLALIREAIMGNNAGSVRGAFETIRDTLGEKPVDRMQFEGGIRFEFDGEDDFSG